jgi:hypothetical protein
MRDLLLHLLARRRRRPPSEAEPETDLIPAALEGQVQSAFPRPAVSDALRTRVALLCREAVEAAPSGRRPWAANRRHWMRIARWGTLGVAVVAMAAVWMSDRPGAAVLAATIRAMESIPVIHVVSRGDKGGHGEIWMVDGVGSFLHSQGRDEETIMVDDLKDQYRYIIPSPSDPGITEPRVEVTPSGMADPKQKAAVWAAYTKAGMLKELQSHGGRGEAQMAWVTEGGRRLCRIHVPGPGRGTTFYSDPITGRIQRIESEGPDIHSNPELIRDVLDYPTLESVDRARFRFEVPAGVVVWDETDGPSRWAKGDEAVCADRMKALREALRRYANDHDAQWPEALRPALDPYVASPELFRCPLGTAGVSIEYHRPGKMLMKQVLEAWNRRKADPSSLPDLQLNGARPAVLECRHPGGPVFSLNADGIIYRWYPKAEAAPRAAVAPPAAAPAALVPQAAPILKALAERERRLDEVKITYDWRATQLVAWEIPSSGPGSNRPTKQGPGDFDRERIVWARKGEKMMRDVRNGLPGGPPHERWITDGESVLMQYAPGPGQPLGRPNAESPGSMGHLGNSVPNIEIPGGPLADLLSGKRGVRYLGHEPVGKDDCVVLEVTRPERKRYAARLWFDPSHGYVLRKAKEYNEQGRLQIVTTASGVREWAPGVYLAAHLDTLGYHLDSRPTLATHRYTTDVRSVQVGGLPDELFQPVPVGGEARRPVTPHKQARLGERVPSR